MFFYSCKGWWKLIFYYYRYLELMRRLQLTYRMEPAGSQGVWGLDDFQFLPFIWGSAQLIGHTSLEPQHFTCEKNVEEHHNKYMFLGCIRFINQVNNLSLIQYSELSKDQNLIYCFLKSLDVEFLCRYSGFQQFLSCLILWL